MILRRLVLAFTLCLPRAIDAQQVIYSSYPTSGELSVWTGLCCYGVSRSSFFAYNGPRARLSTLTVDAAMLYRGFLEVSFLKWNAVGGPDVLETWSGRTFGQANPLQFLRELDVLGGEIYGVQVTAKPGNDPEPQTLNDAAMWRENLYRQSEFSYTTFVFEVTTKVVEPSDAGVLGVGMILSLLAVRRRAISK